MLLGWRLWIYILAYIAISECRTLKKTEQKSMTQRIYGGEVSGPNWFPWQIALWVDSEFYCGGSIINSMTILTAAHCVELPPVCDGGYYIIAGEHDFTKTEGTEQVIPVVKAIVHVEYDGLEIVNDIALLILERPLVFTYAVQPVQLADCEYDEKALLNKYRCYNSGWGEIPYGFPNELYHVRVTLISNAKCEKMLNKFEWHSHPTYICTANYKKGTCAGDSGGPLVCFEPGTQIPVQVGLVSWGHWNCFKPPHVNTRVSKYLSWILLHTEHPNSLIQ